MMMTVATITTDHPQRVGHPTVLIVDDDETSRTIGADLLARFGANVLVAGSGGEALEAVRRCAVELVLLDLMMPGMGGFEAARRIRLLAPTVRIVGVTAATADAELEQRCSAAGISRVLDKPLRLRVVRELLAELGPDRYQL